MEKKKKKRPTDYCFCHTCGKEYHWLGINRHRAMHRDKKQYCEITYTYGNTVIFHF